MKIFAFFLSLFLISCSQTEKTHANLILKNGRFFTADENYQQITAIAVSADTILALGSDNDIIKYAGDNTQIIDLNGAFAMPGFIEGHGHFLSLGESLQNLNLLHTSSWQEIVEMVKSKVQSAQPGEWIEGRGWHQEKWNQEPGITVNGYPYHDALSAVSSDNPVVLYHASGHGLIANAAAMKLAGISSETTDPAGGRIVRDVKGNAIGVFEENAMALIDKPYSEWKNRRPESERQADLIKTATIAAEKCLSLGITSFQDAASSLWELRQLRTMAESGKLPVRIWAMIFQPSENELPELKNYPQIGIASGHFTCRAVKAYFDGALGSYGAWLLNEYSDKPGFTGQNTTPTDTIRMLAKACLDNNLQLCVHAIGDRANREVLDIYESTFNSTGKKGDRWRIEHAQHIDTADIPRFGRLGVIAAMQAIHCTSDAPFVVKRLGEYRARTGAYAWRSLLDSGARIANGTDTPVEEADPLPCLYASITRKRTDTGLEFYPEQSMTRKEALLSYTLWNAYAAFEEKEKGSLTPGKLADIVVLSENLLECAPETLLKAEVLRTIVGGKVVFQR